MNKLSIIGVLFLASCAPKSKEVTLKYPSGSLSQSIEYPNKNDTLTYTIKQYYENGKMRLIASVEQGKYVGVKKVYYSNGVINQIDSLSQPCDTSVDYCDGRVIVYYPNSNIKKRYPIIGGKRNGVLQIFDSLGKINQEYEVKDDSIKNGDFKGYYDNGKLAYKATYKNDTIVGFTYYFDEKGDTVKYNFNEDGHIAFPWKKWLVDGKVIVGDYQYNKNHAAVSFAWIWFDRSGKELKRKVLPLIEKQFIAPE